MKRLFFALWPNDETRQKIDWFNQSIMPNGLKKMRADNLHVTLVFLGNIDVEAEVMIRRSVENIQVEPFALQFDQLTFWKKPRILCLTTHQFDLKLLTLVDALKQTVTQCGIKTELRPYKPHITLARNARKLTNIDAPTIKWQAQSFCLIESISQSNGVHYQVLQHWEFNS